MNVIKIIIEESNKYRELEFIVSILVPMGSVFLGAFLAYKYTSKQEKLMIKKKLKIDQLSSYYSECSNYFSELSKLKALFIEEIGKYEFTSKEQWIMDTNAIVTQITHNNKKIDVTLRVYMSDNDEMIQQLDKMLEVGLKVSLTYANIANLPLETNFIRFKNDILEKFIKDISIIDTEIIEMMGIIKSKIDDEINS